MNNWLRIAHEWLLPRHCLLCLGTATDIDLCAACRDALPRIENPCSSCGAPLVAGQICARCLKSPLNFHRVCIPYRYAGPVPTLIHALKFRHRLAAASVLGQLLAQSLQGATPGLPQCLVPVPLHPRRQRQRGFNQSMEIARPLSRRLDIPIAVRLARRIRATAAQTGLVGAAARQRNMRAAFAVERNFLAGLTHVAIVDDVMTTGATVRSLSLTLKSAGVSRVELWCVARAVDV